MMLYECGVRYERTMENGMTKKVTELYLVDALSFAEAEGRITNERSRTFRATSMWLLSSAPTFPRL